MKTLIIYLTLMIASWAVSGQWVQTNGPRGTLTTQTLAIRNTTVYAGIWSIGVGYTVYRSDDSGGHWVYAGNGLENEMIYALACNGNTVIVSNGYKTFRSFD